MKQNLFGQYFTHSVRLGVLIALVCVQFFAPSTAPVAALGTPFIIADYDNWIAGTDWPLESDVYLTIEGDPEQGVYNDHVPAEPHPDNLGQTWAFFHVAGFQLRPGQKVTLKNEDGSITKSLFITDIPITAIDLENSIISGTTSDPSQLIRVSAGCNGTRAVREIIPSSGNWSANFSQPGQLPKDQTTFEHLTAQCKGVVEQIDDDQDITSHQWNGVMQSMEIVVPEGVNASNWPVGSNLRLTIHDPNTIDSSLDYSAETTIAHSPENGYYQSLTTFYVQNYALKPGFIVTLAGGNITKEMTVPTAAIIGADIATDQVFGTANPADGTISVLAQIKTPDEWGGGEWGVRWQVPIDDNGNWSADFSTPDPNGMGSEVVDIIPGMSIGLDQWDSDNDLTEFGYTVPVPSPLEFLYFNVSSPLMQDKLIRQAIAYGTNRQQILNEAFLPNGQYGMVVDAPVAPESWMAASKIGLTESNIYLYDSGKASAILTGAGWNDNDGDGLVEKNGEHLSLKLKTGSTPARLAAAEIFRQNMAAIGIEVTITAASPDWATCDSDADIVELAWTDPLNTVLPLYGSASGFCGYSNPLFDDAMNNANAAATPQARLPYFVDAQKELMADPPLLPISTLTNVAPVETVAGENVAVTPAENVTISFGSVTEAGLTTVTPIDVNPANMPPNFELRQVYDIGTSAAFTGNVQVCFTYDDTHLSPRDESALSLFHLEENTWVDVTDRDNCYPDTTANVICGNVSSFSPFSLLVPVNRPPVAEAGLDISVKESDPVNLDASASDDPDKNPLTYAWDLDADGLYDDAAGEKVQTTFGDNGPYIVGLQVTDSGGLVATDTVIIHVTNIAPTVNIQQITSNSAGVLSGNGIFADPGTDTWTATVNYGDGKGLQSLALNAGKAFTLSNTYMISGAYKVEVCVKDDDGEIGCGQVQANVMIGHPPVARAGGPYLGFEGVPIMLNASKSTDPENNIVLYRWDFDNDGQFDDATGVRSKFTAIDNGIFLVRVQVTDTSGLSSVAVAIVTVKNLPPVITFLSIPGSITINTSLKARATFMDAGQADTFSATWNWGDGQRTNGLVNGYIVAGSHIYQKPGTYVVTLISKDKDGGICKATKVVVVNKKR